MKERPILFSTDMVMAILEGKKTQTRRVINPQPVKNDRGFWELSAAGWSTDSGPVPVMPCHSLGKKSQYGVEHDILYVRETWKPLGQDPDDGDWTIRFKTGQTLNMGRLYEKEEEDKEIDLSERLADEYNKKGFMPWKPSIFLPKGGSRIWLKVTDVRVERVQDISEQDSIAEGIEVDEFNHVVRHDDIVNWGGAIPEFATLWNSINAKRGFGWDKNPWVWVVTFEVLSTTGKPNPDSPA